MKKVAFLLNQIQMASVKVNTNEKSSNLFKVDTESKNKDSTFVKEFSNAISSKNSSKVNQDLMLKQYKSLQQYKDEKALQSKKLYSEAKKNVLKPDIQTENKPIEANRKTVVDSNNSKKISEVNSKESSNDNSTEVVSKTVDSKTVDSKTVDSKTVDSKSSTENNSQAVNQNDTNSKIKDLSIAKDTEGKDLTEEEKNLTTTLNSNFQEILTQISELINLMQGQVANNGAKKTETTQAAQSKSAQTDSKISDISALLTKTINSKDNPEEFVNSAEKVLNSLTELSTKNATEKTDDTFKNLMSLTNDKMKVIKNEIADAKFIIQALGGFENLKNSLVINQESEFLKDETLLDAKVASQGNTSGVEKSSILKDSLQLNNEEESPRVIGQISSNNKSQDTLLAKNKVEIKTENVENQGIQKIQKNISSETNRSSSNATQSDDKKNGLETKSIEGNLKGVKTGEQIINPNSFSSNLKEIIETKTIEKPIVALTVDKTEILSQIVKKAEVIVGSTQSEMIMKLEPESLGKINLRVSVERGLLTASFQAENQQVKSIIESNMNSLRDMLQEKGINVQAINVSVNQGNTDSQKWNAPTGWNKKSDSKTVGLKSSGTNSVSYIDSNLVETNNFKLNPYTRHLGRLDIKG